ncbi:hypothetical protein UNDKW_0157 [Undibacterium sp. KW1]|nr:hypothetical protein UNDKW_0157 [Undibacterium sp. KW1]
MQEEDAYGIGIEWLGSYTKFENGVIWQPETRAIDIPLSFSGSEWETCLSRIEILVSTYLKHEAAAKVLLASRAVGVGFVDGDLSILWQPQ